MEEAKKTNPKKVNPGKPATSLTTPVLQARFSVPIPIGGRQSASFSLQTSFVKPGSKMHLDLSNGYLFVSIPSYDPVAIAPSKIAFLTLGEK